MRTAVFLLVLAVGVTVFASHRPTRAPKSLFVQPVYCGNMFDSDGVLNKIAGQCVGRVLVLGRIAAVSAPCADGRMVPVLIWVNSDGEVSMQSYSDVCPPLAQDGGVSNDAH